MKTRIAPLLASLLLAACAPTDSTDESDLPFEDGAGLDLSKADHLGLSLTPVDAPVGHDRLEKGGRAILTSSASWQRYFKSDAPADIDWDREWVAFYGSGLQSTGGFSAEILGLSFIAGDELLVLETRDVSPGFDCIVTQALTTPFTLVKFTVPSPAPVWAISDHASETLRCGPSAEELQAQLADSLGRWNAARDAHGNSYTYSQVMHSFIGFSGETTFVVEAGVIVERHFKSQFGADVNTWSELGAEVGSHTDEGHPLALVDDLYQECAAEVLTVDLEQHFVSLGFDDAGLLQTCTAFHRLCNDDCDRGPKLGFIEL
jgi:hypothetical protein